MNNNAKRFNVIGTIGNGSELRPVPRVAPPHSYHVMREYCKLADPENDDPEIAIRYTAEFAAEVEDFSYIDKRPILREVA